jgi:hypothetical protein
MDFRIFMDLLKMPCPQRFLPANRSLLVCLSAVALPLTPAAPYFHPPQTAACTPPEHCLRTFTFLDTAEIDKRHARAYRNIRPSWATAQAERAIRRNGKHARNSLRAARRQQKMSFRTPAFPKPAPFLIPTPSIPQERLFRIITDLTPRTEAYQRIIRECNHSEAFTKHV